ncbi:MAG TPA: clostripain-related cysteine peptidase [Candidatus Xenobia bacterium]|jgi:hypothetical protein
MVSAINPRPVQSQRSKAPQAAPASGDLVQLNRGRDPQAPPKANWTILLYNAADNNLLPNQVQNVVDCQKVGSTPSMNVVSQFDAGGTDGCTRYYVKKSNASKIDSPAVQPMGTVNMADPKTLSDFIQWGVKNYPANHYMVVINDHGDGWRGAVEDDSAGGAFMSLKDIQSGLQQAQDATGTKMDIVGFDACLMANAEVAEQLKNNCDYMVASEETEGSNGWPYTTVVSAATLKDLNQRLLMKADTTAKDFAGAVVKSATAVQGDLPTLSAFDMSQVSNMTVAEKGLSDAIKASSGSLGSVAQAASDSQAFYDTSDLYDFADHLKGNADPSVQKAAQGVKDAIGKVIFAEQHDTSKYPNAHGVTVNLTPSSGDATYSGLDMPKATGWDSMLGKLASAPSPTPNGGGGDGGDDLRRA